MHEHSPHSAECESHQGVEPGQSDSEETDAAVRLISWIEHVVIGEIQRTAEAVCVDEKLHRGDRRAANSEQS